jgi:hypothetical protein
MNQKSHRSASAKQFSTLLIRSVPVLMPEVRLFVAVLAYAWRDAARSGEAFDFFNKGGASGMAEAIGIDGEFLLETFQKYHIQKNRPVRS